MCDFAYLKILFLPAHAAQNLFTHSNHIFLAAEKKLSFLCKIVQS